MTGHKARQPRLSEDLYRYVVEHISPDDTQTLLALLLVSRAFTLEVERILYRCLRVEGVDRQAKLHRRLISCERVARLVRHITFHSKYMTDQSDLPRVLQALQALVNLKSLNLNRMLNSTLATALCSSSFQLARLECRYVTCSPKLFHTMLARQTALRCFKSIDTPSCAIPSPIASKLSVLYAPNNEVLGAFLPGRRIEYLAHRSYDTPISAELIKPLSALRGCMIYPTHESKSLAHAPVILNYIPNVEFLTLAGFELPVANGLRADRFPRLRGLIAEVAAHPDIDEAPARLFAELRTLEWVELAYNVNDGGGARAVRMRWDRGAKPRAVSRATWRFPFTEESF